MSRSEIPQIAIDCVAKHICDRNNRLSNIPIVTVEGSSESPHYFEIVPFDQIDLSNEKNFFAIDGSYNSQDFYNGLSVGIYAGGYVCFKNGAQVRINDLDDPVILGKSYFPNNILISNDRDSEAIFEELLNMEPVKNLIDFFGVRAKDVWGFGEGTKEVVCSNPSKLLSFCQEILEWALLYEIINKGNTKEGDFILRDGTLRSNNIKQEHLIKIAELARKKGVVVLAVTKNSPVKMELSSTFKKIDNYLQDELKPKYPFTITEPRRQKLCCWFEVPDDILLSAYKGEMYARKSLSGGRGFGIFTAARLDYVEKLQNYDWVIVDLNIFDVMPNIRKGDLTRDIERLNFIFKELTRLTQEHYILGYPYPLVEAHNFITVRKDFKEEIIKRVKLCLYDDRGMDNVDIENLFLDIHDRF